MTQPAQYISGRTVQEQMDQLISYVDTRAAEVATDAIAADVAQVHTDAADAHTDALAAAASAASAAGVLADAVKKTGESSQTIAGDIIVSGNVKGATMGSGSTPVTAGDLTAFGNVSLDDTAFQGNVSVANSSALINLSGAGSVLVPAPSSNSEAATKKYVDDADALDVKLAGAQTITGVKSVPLEATGTFTGQAASSQKVKNELDNYAPMVRTTGNQTIGGGKTFTSYPIIKMGNVCRLLFNNTEATIGTLPSTTEQWGVYFGDKDNTSIAGIRMTRNSSGKIEFSLRVYKTDGSFQEDHTIWSTDQVVVP